MLQAIDDNRAFFVTFKDSEDYSIALGVKVTVDGWLWWKTAVLSWFDYAGQNMRASTVSSSEKVDSKTYRVIDSENRTTTFRYIDKDFYDRVVKSRLNMPENFNSDEAVQRAFTKPVIY